MPETQPACQNAASDPAEWVDQHGDALYCYAMLRVRDPEAAEEVVQETFVAALGNRKLFRTESSERTWLIGILKNKIVDQFRRSSRKETTVTVDDPEDLLEQVFTSSGSWRSVPRKWAASAEQTLEDREFRRALVDCLSGLSPQAARTFVLREMEGLDTKEICKVLQISATNVWVMLHRARLGLRRCLEINWFGGAAGKSEG